MFLKMHNNSAGSLLNILYTKTLVVSSFFSLMTMNRC